MAAALREKGLTGRGCKEAGGVGDKVGAWVEVESDKEAAVGVVMVGCGGFKRVAAGNLAAECCDDG